MNGRMVAFKYMYILRNLWFREGGGRGGGGGRRRSSQCKSQGSPLTLGSILVFFRLRHFSAHRSQFGCVIPDLDKNRNPFNCGPSSIKSLPRVPGAEIRALWRKEGEERGETERERGEIFIKTSPFVAQQQQQGHVMRQWTVGSWAVYQSHINGNIRGVDARCTTEKKGESPVLKKTTKEKQQGAEREPVRLLWALPYLLHVFCYINAHWWKETLPPWIPLCCMQERKKKKGRGKEKNHDLLFYSDKEKKERERNRRSGSCQRSSISDGEEGKKNRGQKHRSVHWRLTGGKKPERETQREREREIIQCSWWDTRFVPFFPPDELSCSERSAGWINRIHTERERETRERRRGEERRGEERSPSAIQRRFTPWTFVVVVVVFFSFSFLHVRMKTRALIQKHKAAVRQSERSGAVDALEGWFLFFVFFLFFFVKAGAACCSPSLLFAPI